MKVADVIIIGAGPAGIAAAIQLKRQGIIPVIIENNIPGGLILNANKIENYPGFPGGISGLQVSKLLKKHLEKWNITPVKDEVVRVNFEEIKGNSNSGCFKVKCKKNIFKCRSLIIASGTKPKVPDVKIPNECKNKIFFEIESLLKIKNKSIAIIGGGDAAFDYALNLSQYNQVKIFNRSAKISALKLLVERVKATEGIMYNQNTNLIEITKHGNQLELFFNQGKRVKKIISDYLVFAIGREQNLDFLSEELKKNLSNLIMIKRLYLIGDVKNEKLRQLSIAVGDGVKAAMEVGRF